MGQLWTLSSSTPLPSHDDHEKETVHANKSDDIILESVEEKSESVEVVSDAMPQEPTPQSATLPSPKKMTATRDQIVFDYAVQWIDSPVSWPTWEFNCDLYHYSTETKFEFMPLQHRWVQLDVEVVGKPKTPEEVVLEMTEHGRVTQCAIHGDSLYYNLQSNK